MSTCQHRVCSSVTLGPSRLRGIETWWVAEWRPHRDYKATTNSKVLVKASFGQPTLSHIVPFAPCSGVKHLLQVFRWRLVVRVKFRELVLAMPMNRGVGPIRLAMAVQSVPNRQTSISSHASTPRAIGVNCNNQTMTVGCESDVAADSQGEQDFQDRTDSVGDAAERHTAGGMFGGVGKTPG